MNESDAPLDVEGDRSDAADHSERLRVGKPYPHQEQVSIFCVNNHARWEIVLFAGGTANTIWTAVDGIGPLKKNLRGVGRARATLGVDNQRLSIDELTSETPPAERRERWQLRCRHCGLSVAVRREGLTPILDTLIKGGVYELSLAALAARLRLR